MLSTPRAPYAYYRTRLVLDLSSGLVIPGLVLKLVLDLLCFHPHGWLSIVFYMAGIVVVIAARIRLKVWRQQRDAARLGATVIPTVVGRWPGNLDILFRMMKAFKTAYVLDVYRTLFEEYQCTTLNLRILWIDQIITMDEQHSKFVLATGFEHFWRGHLQKERMETFLGAGIFNRDDETWKMHRALARPFFAKDRYSDLELFETHCAHTLSIISRLTSSGQPCEVQDLFGRFTLDSSSEYLFGKNLDSLSATLPQPNQRTSGPKGSFTSDTWGSFTHAFESAQQVVTLRARLGYYSWPLLEMFGDKSLPHQRIIREYLDPLVQDVLEQKSRSSGVPSPIVDKTFVQHLADSKEDATLIRDQVLSMLLASRDTTASLLTFVMYFMCIHPEIVSKLRAEVLEHCGVDQAPTYATIRELRYMRAVVNETLRLFPPIPLNVRESRAQSIRLPPSDNTYSASSTLQQLYMPKNTLIVYLPLLTQRNPSLWGPDAETFNPERWLDPVRIAEFVKNPAKYAPFSAGPRICMGQNFALNEASYLLVRILQQYDTFTLAPEAQAPDSLPPVEWRLGGTGRARYEKVWPAAAMTLFIKGGLWVRFGKSSHI